MKKLFVFIVCMFTAIKSDAGTYDSSVSHLFGDMALSNTAAGPSAQKAVGFQFFLSNTTKAFLLTCTQDSEYRKDRPHWKIVLRHCQLPAPPGRPSSLRPRPVPSFTGNFVVAYIDMAAVDAAQKEVLKLIFEINDLNQKLTSDFSVDAVGRADSMSRNTEMQISVSKNSEGKNSIVVGTYLGFSYAKSTAAFEVYERVLFQLVKILE